MKFLIVILFVLFASEALASTVEFSWETSETQDMDVVVGWNIHYGTEPGVYTQNTRILKTSDIKEHTGAVIDLLPDTQYYFVASAFSEHEESEYSNEIAYKTVNLFTPVNFVIEESGVRVIVEVIP